MDTSGHDRENAEESEEIRRHGRAAISAVGARRKKGIRYQAVTHGFVAADAAHGVNTTPESTIATHLFRSTNHPASRRLFDYSRRARHLVSLDFIGNGDVLESSRGPSAAATV